MLSAPPPAEAAFYTNENNVADWKGKTWSDFRMLEDRYGFLNGSQVACIEYFLRDDLPQVMWEYRLVDEIKSVAGFSTAPKKYLAKQRRLLMCMAANYAFAEASVRTVHGMQGGTALASLIFRGAGSAVASVDESNAFSDVRVPPWWVSQCRRRRRTCSGLASPGGSRTRSPRTLGSIRATQGSQSAVPAACMC